jgi:hypothetical protein
MGLWVALHSVRTYFMDVLSTDFEIETGQGRQHNFYEPVSPPPLILLGK